VLHDDGDGVRFRVERGEQTLVGALLHGALAQLLVITEEADGVLQVGSRELVRHKRKFATAGAGFARWTGTGLPVGFRGVGHWSDKIKCHDYSLDKSSLKRTTLRTSGSPEETPVTVAAGFNFTDGIVLCTDTKHTYPGAMKLQSPKIFKKEDYASGLKTAFCIVGSVRYCKMIIQKCEGALTQLAKHECSKVEVRTVIETVLLAVFQEHIYKHPDFSRGALSAGFLIGIWSPVDGLGFYSTEDTAINELLGYECLGSGSYLGHYILRALFRRNLHFEQVALLATHMLIQTKNYDDSCGGDSQFVWLRTDGSISEVAYFDISQNESYSQWLQDALRMIFYDIPNLDLTEEEFQGRLTYYKSHLETIRENLQHKKFEYDALIKALTTRVGDRLEARHKREAAGGNDKATSP
jgi:20S proteasome alpha/beta subunit